MFSGIEEKRYDIERLIQFIAESNQNIKNHYKISILKVKEKLQIFFDLNHFHRIKRDQF